MSAADFIRNFGNWQARVSQGPIVVTHHGRERLFVMSPESFAELKVGGTGPASKTPIAAGEQASLEIVTDSLDDCFIAFDGDLRVTHVNAQACAYLRLGRSQLQGRALTETIPQASGSLGFNNVARALSTGHSASIEVQSLLYPDRWLRVKTFPFPSGSACVFRDVTDEVEERDMRDIYHATRQALLAHGMVGRCVLSPRATFQEVDAPFAALVGLQPEGLHRARFHDIFPVSCRAKVRECVEHVLDTGETRTLDTQLLRRGHAEEPVRLSMASLPGPHDRGVVVIATRR